MNRIPWPQRVTLRDILVEDPDLGVNSEFPLIKIDELQAELSLHKNFTSGSITSLTLKNPIVHFTPALIAALRHPASNLQGPCRDPSRRRRPPPAHRSPCAAVQC